MFYPMYCSTYLLYCCCCQGLTLFLLLKSEWNNTFHKNKNIICHKHKLRKSQVEPQNGQEACQFPPSISITNPVQAQQAQQPYPTIFTILGAYQAGAVNKHNRRKSLAPVVTGQFIFGHLCNTSLVFIVISTT